MDKKQRKQHRVGRPSRLSAGKKRNRKQSLSFDRGDDGNLRVEVLGAEGDLDVIVDREGAFELAGQERAA